ncbi:hypothetical protein IQ268_23805 [Oculatella sp. LEGE 06141]|nr:hypothetical protein [Oculatella sp. LEGE 06141]
MHQAAAIACYQSVVKMAATVVAQAVEAAAVVWVARVQVELGLVVERVVWVESVV